MPESMNGAVNDRTSTSPVMSPIASTAKTVMKTNSAPTSTMFMPVQQPDAEDVEPGDDEDGDDDPDGLGMLGK